MVATVAISPWLVQMFDVARSRRMCCSRVAIVSTGALVILAGVAVLGGLNLGERIVDLINMAIEQIEVLGKRLEDNGFIPAPESAEGEGTTGIGTFLPDPETLFGHAQTAFGLTTGVLTNTVIILFLGLFFAANPSGYRDGERKPRQPGTGYGKSSGYGQSHHYADQRERPLFRCG